jgi:hypothetical protein
MKIQVTQRDISLANKRKNLDMGRIHNCPIALAFKRVTKGKCSVGITSATIRGRSVNLPNIATRNINKWDAGKRMYPFTFEI